MFPILNIRLELNPARPYSMLDANVSQLQNILTIECGGGGGVGGPTNCTGPTNCDQDCGCRKKFLSISHPLICSRGPKDNAYYPVQFPGISLECF